MKKIRGLCLPVVLGIVLIPQHVRAADNLAFKRKLITLACTVQDAEVNWGDIEIQNLVQSGGNQKDFTVDMNCPYSLGTMKVTITPNGQMDNSMLVSNTSITPGDGLFIYLYNSNSSGIGNAVTLGSQFTPGEITETAPARKVTFYAELGYKGDIQSLRVRTLSAMATLAASYSQQCQLKYVNSISHKIKRFLCRSLEGG